jgi:hypothetical protein
VIRPRRVSSGKPVSSRAAERRLAIKSLSAPEPSGLSYVLYGTHPTTMDRIAMTYAWEDWARRH